MKRVLLALSILLMPGVASAHEVLHTVERGKAIAVKAYYADGEALAYTEYQIFSPADPKIPYQKGRTDRVGYVAFVPDVPGKWRVTIADTTGHGLDVEVDAAVSSQPAGTPSQTVATWAFAVRPVLGVLLIAALFALLVFIYRRKKS